MAEQAVAWAEEHLFDRRSVVNEHELWRHALGYARGQNVTLKDIQSVTGKRDYIRDEKPSGQSYDPRALAAGMGRLWKWFTRACARHQSFCQDYRCANPSLDAEQRLAVEKNFGNAPALSNRFPWQGGHRQELYATGS